MPILAMQFTEPIINYAMIARSWYLSWPGIGNWGAAIPGLYDQRDNQLKSLVGMLMLFRPFSCECFTMTIDCT